METSQETLDSWVANPIEGLNVEVKRWIDPRQPLGESKIAIACMALRNRNGGHLIIGFDDRTLQPLETDRPADVRETFHSDTIVSIVSRYASASFDVSVGFGVRPEGIFPVIVVAPGVRVPVAAKKPLDLDGKALIRQHAVYFRTLNSNGLPSSAMARHADWPEIVEICFENREADIGRFLRKHLGSRQRRRFTEFAPGIDVDDVEGDRTDPQELLKARTFDLLVANDIRRRQIFESDEFRAVSERIAGHGSWATMLVIDPPFQESDTTRGFLNTISSLNPHYTGWPVWLDSSGFTNPSFRPRKSEKGWDTILLDPGRTWGSHADFYRINARGEFYLWRVLGDDMVEKVEPRTAFDPSLMVFRVAETIAVGLAIAKGLGRDEGTSLAFAYNWEHLRGRQLLSWSDPRRYFSHYDPAHDDQAQGYVVVPAGTPVDSIAPFVQEATRDLFGIWGMEYPLASLEQSVAKLISRSF